MKVSINKNLTTAKQMLFDQLRADTLYMPLDSQLPGNETQEYYLAKNGLTVPNSSYACGVPSKLKSLKSCRGSLKQHLSGHAHLDDSTVVLIRMTISSTDK